MFSRLMFRFGLSEWAIVSMIATGALAQTVTNTSTSNCNGQIRDIRSGDFFYNGTDNATFNLNDGNDWRLTFTLSDFRNNEETLQWTNATQMQSTGFFLSVPEKFIGSTLGNDTSYCVYLGRGVNETSDGESGDGTHGCNNVLSSECIEALQDLQWPADHTAHCPSPSTLATREACGIVGWHWSNLPKNFSDPGCTVSDIPGIRLPRGHRTYDIMWLGWDNRVDSPDSFDRYDMFMRQSWPMLITSQRVDGRNMVLLDSALICLSGSNSIAEGSREPEGEFLAPDDDSDDDQNGDEGNRASREWISVANLILALVVVGIFTFV